MSNSTNKPFIALAILSALFGLSFLLSVNGFTSVVGGFFFSFSLLGLRFPKQVLAVFLFCLAYKHKDFAYVSLQADHIPIYIAEWMLLILGISSVSKLQFLYKEYRKPLLFILLYFGVGAFLYAKTVFYWGIVEATRDFVIIYYSFFTLLFLAHVRNLEDLKWLIGAIALGTLPNLFSEVLNFLYGTLPVTDLQKNYSLRNSFYYTVVAGFVLPFIFTVRRGWGNLLKLYFLGLFFIIFFYSYSKTGMLALLFILVAYAATRHFDIPRNGYLAVVLLIVLSLFFTPQQKTHPLGSLLNPQTYSRDVRRTILVAEMRDFTGYPYGIGFGGSVFGNYSNELLKNSNYHDPHNSYVSVLRRVGMEGMLVYLTLIWYALYSAIKIYRELDKESYEARITLGSILAFIVASFYLFGHVALEGPFFGVPYWILLGVLCSCSKLFKRNMAVQ